jgi:hypothetical protein
MPGSNSMVRDRRSSGGEALGRVHGGAAHRGRHAEAEQQAGRGDAVGHAQGAVDELCSEADDDIQQKIRGQFHAGEEPLKVFQYPRRPPVSKVRTGISA